MQTFNSVTLTQANKNIADVLKDVDRLGSVVILDNNKPKYIIAKAETAQITLTEDEAIEVVAKRILKKHKKAFEALAQ